MEGYLFPITHPSTPTPSSDFIKKVLPSARKSVFIIDPQPDPSLIKQISHYTSTNVSRRILLKFNPIDYITDLQNTLIVRDYGSSGKIFDIDIRFLPDLSARIYIVDDAALIISGNTRSKYHYGVNLPTADSQPVIEYWEELWKSARKLRRDSIKNLQSTTLKRLQNGDVTQEDLARLINQHGSFVDIHATFFTGYRKIKIEPFTEILSQSQQQISISWSLIQSTHFKSFSRVAGRVHAIKFKSYLIDTPIGPFLLNKDLPRWQSEFNKRRNDLKNEVESYLSNQYKTIRAESLKELKTRLEQAYSQLSSSPQLIPVPSVSGFIEKAVEEYSVRFPTKQQLIDSCSCVFARYGLHPETVQDKDMMKILDYISFQLELI